MFISLVLNLRQNLSHCNSHCQTFENAYTLVTLNKACENQREINNICQTCHHDSGHLEVSATKNKNKLIVRSISHIVEKKTLYLKA